MKKSTIKEIIKTHYDQVKGAAFGSVRVSLGDNSSIKQLESLIEITQGGDVDRAKVIQCFLKKSGGISVEEGHTSHDVFITLLNQLGVAEIDDCVKALQGLNEPISNNELNQLIDRYVEAAHQYEEATQYNNEHTFFAQLSSVIAHQILPKLEGPCVEIIEGEPTEDQGNQVKAVAGDGKTPLINTYHIITYEDKDDYGNNIKTYQIGYCKWSDDKQALEYVKEKIDEKSGLYTLVSEDPDLNSEGISQDRTVIYYLEKEIKKAGGLTFPRELYLSQLADRWKFSQTCKLANEVMKSSDKKSDKQELVDELLFYASVSELSENKEILEDVKMLQEFPELMQSDAKETVTVGEYTFHDTTWFQLAYLLGDWDRWQSMMDYIPEDQKEDYIADLGKQLTELDETGIQYTLNNLKKYGLRILDAEPTDEIKTNVEKRDSYLFIIEKDEKTKKKIYSIGFRDPEAGSYAEKIIDADSDLIQYEDNMLEGLGKNRNNGLHFYVTRNNHILAAAKVEIEKHGGRAEIKGRMSQFDLQPLMDELEAYNNNYANYSLDQKKEHWCLGIGPEMRELPRLIFEYWMRDKIDFSDVMKKDFEGSRPLVASEYSGRYVFPISNSLGGDYSYGGLTWSCRAGAGGGAGPAWAGRAACFLKCFLSSKESKERRLMQDLGLEPSPEQSPSFCVM